MPGAPATKAKTRNVLSSLFQHARRYEFVATNPVSLVRQSAVRLKEPEVLTPEEVRALLDELDNPARTIVHLAATTGIRRGELFGLKWADVDLANGRLKIARSIVDQSVGETKLAAPNVRCPFRTMSSRLFRTGELRRGTAETRIGFLPVRNCWVKDLIGPTHC